MTNLASNEPISTTWHKQNGNNCFMFCSNPPNDFQSKIQLPNNFCHSDQLNCSTNFRDLNSIRPMPFKMEVSLKKNP